MLSHPGRWLPQFVVQLRKIPIELRSLDQWVMYNRIPQPPKKAKKPPLSVKGGTASVDLASSWASFESAVSRLHGGFDGIGFVFTDADPYCGIDLDHCRDPKTGAIEPWASEIVDRLHSYTEVSVSGSGLHIIIKAHLRNVVGRRKGRVEMYDRGRYFTMNGSILGGRDTIREAQGDIEAVHAQVFARRAIAVDGRADDATPSVAPVVEDAAIVQLLTEGGPQSKSGLLWAGNFEGLYESQSEADLALIAMIARNTTDSVQIDRIFRASKLYREKWDEKHGERTYGEMTIQCALDGQSVDDNPLIDELNSEFAVVSVGDKVRILRVGCQEVGPRNISMLTAQDFCILVRNRHKESPGPRWLRHKRRREFHGIEFKPGGGTPGFFNLWQPSAIRAVKGKSEKFWEFVKNVICSGHQDLYLYIRKYFAHLIQKPNELPETAIVLRGPQGVGKNTFADTFGALVTPHYRTVSRMEQVTGRFNGHLQGALLLHANEALWGGNKSDGGAIKSLITDRLIAIEGKGRDIIMIDNFCRTIISSNEMWCVGVDIDDRRFVIVDVSDKHQQDKDYFQAIRDELKNGGLEAILYDLQCEDISNFSPRVRPRPRSGWDIKIASADSVTQWLFDVLTRGSLDSSHMMPDSERDLWPKTVQNGSLYAWYRAYCDEKGERRKYDEAGFFKLLAKRMGTTMSPLRPASKGSRRRAKQFASLDICREAFAKALGAHGLIPWDE